VNVSIVFMSGLLTVMMVSSTGPLLAAGAAGAAGAAAGCTRGGAQAANATIAKAGKASISLRREIVVLFILVLLLVHFWKFFGLVFPLELLA
jgi:hypothetical protein